MTGSNTGNRSSAVAGKSIFNPRARHNGLEYPALFFQPHPNENSTPQFVRPSYLVRQRWVIDQA
jgi:hypothetical protein